MSDDEITPEMQELSDKIQAYFTYSINFFDQATSTVTYIALIFSTVFLINNHCFLSLIFSISKLLCFLL